MRVQFISSKPIRDYGTTRLRCLQPAAYLNGLGYDVSVGNIREVKPIQDGVIFFHRTATNAFTRAYRNYAKSLGNVLVYDTDDLIKPNESAYGGAFLENCDAVSVSTDYLRDRYALLHKDVHVIRNALADEYFLKAGEVFRSREQRTSDLVTIGYLSGSATHDEDFGEVQELLLELLLQHPNLRVVIAGKISFSDQFHQFRNRFQYYSFLPYENYIDLYREIDINIAPLNAQLAFNNGRSELKYMEAGACGIPTIASKTDTYCRIIKHSENGMLAGNVSDWRSSLQKLITNVEIRRDIGMIARDQILERYTERIRGRDYSRLIEYIFPRCKRKRKIPQSLMHSVLTTVSAKLVKPPPQAIHN
jgi:glycosyltransferase involved in cell wall biosynthesis